MKKWLWQGRLGYDGTMVLPFIGLNHPWGVAVDHGDVYVTDSGSNQVLKLPVQ